jgi:hypothetical protein
MILKTAYRHLTDPKFFHFVIREKSHVYHALKHFFQVKEVVGKIKRTFSIEFKENVVKRFEKG